MMKKSNVIFLAKKPILTDSQLDKLADIFIATGQLSLAFMVFPFIIPGLDKSRLIMIVLGLVGTAVCWIISVLIVRRLK